MAPKDQQNLLTGFQMPRRLASDVDSLTDRYGRFSAQPFERGFGTTLGNSLRRALLSSIEGAAITAVKIEGVEHEFSSINGVVEDATDVILNLKKVPFKLYGNEAKTLMINKEGAGEVTSADIEIDADVEVLDPNIHIATILGGGSLHIEMRLKSGRGYVSADRNFDEDLSLGYIPIDSVHTPVKKVNYTVEAARLDQNTEFDKLTMEVWTDGSVRPDDAIGLAAKLIKDHLAIFINFEEDTDDYTYTKMERPTLPRNDHLDRSVDELELSVRSYNCLKNADIRTIRELVQRSEREMLATKNFGKKSLNEIKDILNRMGLDFGMEFDIQGNPIPGTDGREGLIYEDELTYEDEGEEYSTPYQDRRAWPARESNEDRQYIVRRGDTLSKISRRFYGDLDKYEEIFYANRDKIESPDNIQVGMELTIPPAESVDFTSPQITEEADKALPGESITTAPRVKPLYINLWVEDHKGSSLPPPISLVVNNAYKFLFAVENKSRKRDGASEHFVESELLKQSHATKSVIEVHCSFLENGEGFESREVDYYSGQGFPPQIFNLKSVLAGRFYLTARLIVRGETLYRKVLVLNVTEEVVESQLKEATGVSITA
jgi:DNA-directed RNA polymerase subunit alpha